MGNLGCVGDAPDSSERRCATSGSSVVDDEEILFIGRNVAQDVVHFTQGDSVASVATREEIFGTERAHEQAKTAIADLVRSLIKGHKVAISSASGGTVDCTAYIDAGLTQLTFKRGNVLSLRKVALESVAEVSAETVPGADRYRFGYSSVRLQLAGRGESLVIQLGSREDCDIFVIFIRACVRHLHTVAAKVKVAATAKPTSAEAEPGSAVSVPSTVVRTVAMLKGFGLQAEGGPSH